MSREEFWRLVEASRKQVDQYGWLRKQLRRLSKEAITGFQVNLRGLMIEACSFPLLAANFVIQSYVSDDVFEDFRAWLVSQGKRRFKAAISNPETIAGWLRREEVDEIDGEPL